MSTDTSSDLETRLRSDLPRLADALTASGGEPGAEHDHLVRLEPDDDGGRGWRRGPVMVVAAAAAVLVLLGVLLAIRGNDDHTAKPVDVGPAPVEAGWAPMATSPLSPREAAVSVWTGTEMIVWGGRVGNTALLDGAAYNPATDTWRTITPNSWGHPAAHAVWTGTEMVVLAKNGGAAYDPATDSWRDLPLSESGNRVGGFIAPVWTGSELLGIGWQLQPNDAAFLGASKLAADGSSWTTGAAIDPGAASPADADYQVVWTGTEAVVWNGARQGWAYDPTADRWRSLTELNGPRGTATVLSKAAWADGSIYAITQQLGSTVPVIGVLRLTPDGWQSVTSIEGRSIEAHAGVTAAGDEIAVLPISGSPLVVDPAAPAVSSIEGPPSPGANQSVVWTGDQLVVWGGVDGSGQVTANGWRWHPGG